MALYDWHDASPDTTASSMTSFDQIRADLLLNTIRRALRGLLPDATEPEIDGALCRLLIYMRRDR